MELCPRNATIIVVTAVTIMVKDGNFHNGHQGIGSMLAHNVTKMLKSPNFEGWLVKITYSNV